MSKPAYFERAHAGVRGLSPYEPGMPVEELQRRLGVADAVKLASNENPLGCSPKVVDALREALGPNLARYPDGSGFRLKRLLGEMHGIEPQRITLGNGSNDILEFLARVFLAPGTAAMYSKHAFAVYPIVTQAQGANAIVVAARPADDPMPYGHDLTAFARQLDRRVALVFIANPNNPTGTWLPPAEIETFLEHVPESTVVVLDEAYHEYAEPETRPDSRVWLDRYPNLVVTRTFSKVYGLAGLRVGYGLSHPCMADLLNRVRQPFNNNSLALLAAETALQDREFVQRSVASNTAERSRLAENLRTFGLRCLPSQANFVAVDFARDAAPVHRGLLERGVIVRPMASYAMPKFLRLTVGTAAENDRALAALKDVLGR